MQGSTGYKGANLSAARQAIKTLTEEPHKMPATDLPLPTFITRKG